MIVAAIDANLLIKLHLSRLIQTYERQWNAIRLTLNARGLDDTTFNQLRQQLLVAVDYNTNPYTRVSSQEAVSNV